MFRIIRPALQSNYTHRLTPNYLQLLARSTTALYGKTSKRFNIFSVLKAKFSNDCNQSIPKNLLEQAIKYFEQGEKLQAKETLAKSLYIDVNTYVNSGDFALKQLQDPDIALRFYHFAFKNDDFKDSRVRTRLGQCHLYKRNFSEAESVFIAARDKEPERPSLHNWLGITHLLKGTQTQSYKEMEESKEHAIQHFTNALKYSYCMTIQENIVTTQALSLALYPKLKMDYKFISVFENGACVVITQPILEALALEKSSKSNIAPNPDNLTAIRNIHEKIGLFRKNFQNAKEEAYIIAVAFLKNLLKKEKDVQKRGLCNHEKNRTIHKLLFLFENYPNPKFEFFRYGNLIQEAYKIDSEESGYPVIKALIQLNLGCELENRFLLQKIGIQLDKMQLDMNMPRLYP